MTVPAGSAWLRQLATRVEPEQWRVEKDDSDAEYPFGWVWPHGAYSTTCEEDNVLIALAPQLALLCADMADALRYPAPGEAQRSRTLALLARLDALQQKDSA